MKRIAFAIQMIALMAMFPAFLIVELNHGTKRLPVNNSPTEMIGMPEESITQPVLNTQYEVQSFSVINRNAYYLNQ